MHACLCVCACVRACVRGRQVCDKPKECLRRRLWLSGNRLYFVWFSLCSRLLFSLLIRMCIFCGEKNESFTEEMLDVHYWKSCPMLKRCDHCAQVITTAMVPKMPKIVRK